MFEVEIVYVSSMGLQQIISIQAREDETVEQVIHRSNIIQKFPEIDLNQLKVGIFGKRVDLTHLLAPKDRVEIYRSLITDPKTARRLRARKKFSCNARESRDEKRAKFTHE